MSSRPLAAITGIGCLAAPGSTLPQCLEAMDSGERCPLPPGRFSSAHPSPFPVFELPDAMLSALDMRGEDVFRTTRYALAAAHEAISDAGFATDALKGLRVGVCMGTTVACSLNDEAYYAAFRAGSLPEPAPYERYLRSNPAAYLAGALGLTGPCLTVTTACASGTDAIGIGASWLRSGECDLVLAGGADELCRVTYNGFISLKVTDETPCKPFDAGRKGLNLGEGAAVLVLESPEAAQRRKRPPRSFLLGYGTACDAYHLTAPSPEGSGLKKALGSALTACGRKHDEVAFVNVHGTATLDNDRVEAKVLTEFFPGLPFLSTKGYTGHMLGAAGAVEAAFTAAHLERGKVPSSAGFSTPDPELGATPTTELCEIPREGLALSQSLAFGGHNSVLLFGNEPGGGR